MAAESVGATVEAINPMIVEVRGQRVMQCGRILRPQAKGGVLSRCGHKLQPHQLAPFASIRQLLEPVETPKREIGFHVKNKSGGNSSRARI